MENILQKLESMKLYQCHRWQIYGYSLKGELSRTNEDGTGRICLARLDENGWWVSFDICAEAMFSQFVTTAAGVYDAFEGYESFLSDIGNPNIEKGMEIFCENISYEFNDFSSSSHETDWQQIIREFAKHRKVCNILQKAIFRTKEISPEYWDIMLKTRTAGAESSGSFWDLGTNDLERCLNSVFEWKIVEGSPEEGRVVIRNFGDIQGWSGVCKKKSLSEANISVLENPKTGIKEQVMEYADIISASQFNTGLPVTYDTYIIISFKDPETGEINPEKPFILTLFPGEYLPSDACYEGGEYVKIINVGDLPRGYGYKDRLNSRQKN